MYSVKTHRVPEQLILPATERLASDIETRREAETGQSIADYTRRIVGAVSDLGFSVEYQATAQLHRIMEAPGINPDYFLQYEHNIPMCVMWAAYLLDGTRHLPAQQRLQRVLGNPVAAVVTFGETTLNLDHGIYPAPSHTNQDSATAEYLHNSLEPILPPVDMPV